MVLLVIISLLLSALFSGMEMAYVTSDSVKVKLDVNKGGLINRLIDRYYSSRELFITTILVGNNIVLVIYGIGAAALLDPWFKSLFDSEIVILLVQTLVTTAVILLVGEFLPKTVFKINPNTSLKLFALPVFIFYLVLYPISWFTSWLSKSMMKICGIKVEDNRESSLSMGDLNQYIEKSIDPVNADNNKEVENEVKIFHNALDFSTIHLRDCMIPRNEIVAVNIETTSRDDLSDLFTKSGRSKIVVYREDIDNVLGYIHVSELFDPTCKWTDHIKPVIFVPESLLANKLMRRLLAEKRSMAIVIDEFGGTAGLVTLEDLVEEIFGDIRDEHDVAELTARKIDDRTYEFSGRTEIETLRDVYHIDVPESDEYQTIAGYLLTSTGALPALNEPLVIDGITFTVTRRTSTRLELIKIVLPEDDKKA